MMLDVCSENGPQELEGIGRIDIWAAMRCNRKNLRWRSRVRAMRWNRQLPRDIGRIKMRTGIQVGAFRRNRGPHLAEADVLSTRNYRDCWKVTVDRSSIH